MFSQSCSVGVSNVFNSGKDTSVMDPKLFRLSMTMTWQSIIKHVLTEGDKLILSWFSPLQDQGGYALAVNYGTSPL
jgi:oligosaccharide translocation protein RFT1